jgi:hypothetical protein
MDRKVPEARSNTADPVPPPAISIFCPCPTVIEAASGSVCLTSNVASLRVSVLSV